MKEFILFCVGVLVLAAAVLLIVMAYSMFKEMREEQ